MNPPAPAAAAPSWLARIVVKDRIVLGGLPRTELSGVLGLVWRALPADAVLDEKQVNALLKDLLAGAAVFLDTDHVELRRWLVDAGWLARDGYGREYRRIAAGAMPPAQAALASSLADIDPQAWIAAMRGAHRARREARRRAWLGDGASPAAAGPDGAAR